MFKYRQLIIKEVLDINEPIYAVNEAKILEDWTTTLFLRKLLKLVFNKVQRRCIKIKCVYQDA